MDIKDVKIDSAFALMTKNYLTYFAFLLSVTGLLLSVVHYHSEMVECLEHSADEQHYVESEFLCPICSLVVTNDIDYSPEIQPSLEYQEFDFTYTSILPETEWKFELFSRPPPSIA